MAIEQKELSEPTNQIKPMSAPPVDTSKASNIEAITKLGEGVIQAVDKFATDKIIAGLDSSVEQALTNTSFEETDLENAPSISPEQTRKLLAAEPGTRNFVNEIDKLAASQRQGRGAKGTLDRADAVVKRYINEFPGRAQEIRDHASNTLGLKQGVQAALDAAREDAEFQRSVEKSIKQDYVQRAVNEGMGYVAVFEDGSVDVETTAERGRVLQMLDEELGFKAGKRGGGAGGGGGGGDELSQTELVDVETRDLQGYVAGRLATLTPSWNTQLKALVTNPATADNKQAQTQEILKSLALQREAEIQNIELKFRGQYSDDAIDESVAFINSQFDRFNTLATIDAKMLADQVDVLQNAAKVRAHTQLPTIVMLKEAGLSDYVGSMFGTMRTLYGSELENTVANEIKSINTGTRQVKPETILPEVAKIAKDGKPFASLAIEEQEKALQTSVAFMNEMVKNRNTMGEQQRGAFLNLFTQTATAGIQVESTESLNNAVKVFAQKGYKDTLEQVASDPNMKEKANIAGQLANNLALKAFHRTAPEMLKDFSDAEGFTVVYDPSTERVEWELEAGQNLSKATPEEVKAYRISPLFTKDIQHDIKVPSTLKTKRLNALNNSLNVLVDLKNFSTYKENFSGMSDRQIKEALVAAQGIPIKGGQSSSLSGLNDAKMKQIKETTQAQKIQAGGENATEKNYVYDPATGTWEER